MRFVRMARLFSRSSPNHSGGGTLKMSVRDCVANTNMK
jgi:hypothetical protein